jgi:RHS repeat-associated protein
LFSCDLCSMQTAITTMQPRVCSFSVAFWHGYKFTGKERDSESGLDNFVKRYFGSSLGRFMTPDAFYKDSHVGDPQSWNEYAYARNNPLRYVDPTGQNATVSTSCSTTNNQTTCNVSISASIAIYAAPGSGLTQEQLNGAATTIQNSIQNAWSGSFSQDGVTYNVSTQVSIQVADSESDASKTGAQNVIGLTNGNARPNADSVTGPASSFGTFLRGQDSGLWNYNSLGPNLNVAAHEFGHLLGVGDRDSGDLVMNTNLWPVPNRSTAADLGWGIREATGSVSLGSSMKNWYDGSAGPLPSSFSFSTTVGVPWGPWWK